MEKYKRIYEINSSSCDKDKKLRLRTLFNFFQDLADYHADGTIEFARIKFEWNVKIA